MIPPILPFCAIAIAKTAFVTVSMAADSSGRFRYGDIARQLVVKTDIASGT